MDFLKLIEEGGFIMYPLIICSLAVWAVAIQKFWFYLQFDKQFRMLSEKAGQLVKENKIHEAKGLCHSAHPLIGLPYLALLEKHEDKNVWEGRVARRLSETKEGLKNYLWILGTVGSSAPFIGLFGTVVGIIKSFDSIARAGKSGFAVVAAGLSEALIATAAGILVAVIAVVFYNYFQTKISSLLLDFKNRLEDIGDHL
ncbi:MAG: MotA/TolQ/ExbB proton channel family protein [Bacteriovoracaceae bacterium]|nr:MotA/TolQ/ExbB proton channel family protein [Bacteriovoracaceae bacterium]